MFPVSNIVIFPLIIINFVSIENALQCIYIHIIYTYVGVIILKIVWEWSNFCLYFVQITRKAFYIRQKNQTRGIKGSEAIPNIFKRT